MRFYTIMLIMVISAIQSGYGEATGSANTNPQEIQASNQLSEQMSGYIIWMSNRDGDWEIYRMDIDGGVIQKLTDNEVPDRGARISDDGKLIAWHRGDDRRRDVWIMNADGSQRRMLVPNAVMGMWHSDGELVVHRGRNEDISFLYDINTGKEKKIWPPENVKLKARDIRRAVPSPDGKLFVAWASKPRGIWIFSSNGKTQKHVHGGCEGNFAPDGSFIYWVMDAGTFGMAKPDGEDQAPLYKIGKTHYGHAYFPRLSKDMKYLIFGACPNDQHDQNTADYEIFLMKMESLKPAWQMPIRLTHDPGTDRSADIFVQTDEAAIARFNASCKRTESRIMMRVIAKPTRARLDSAAYDRNPLFHSPHTQELTSPKPRPKLDNLDFGGSLVSSSLSDRIEDIPLSAQDRASPMAWRPMLDFLADWDYDRSVELMIIGGNVSKEKWGNAEIARPLQQITTAYIHAGKGEIWVKVEFEPYIRFLESVDDEDGDGYAEIYGRIDKVSYSPELLAHLRSDYLTTVLTPDEVDDYFHQLSSDWYGALKTETLDMEANRPWPNSETEPEVVRELGGLIIKSATAIISGKPFGSPIYNVFLVKESKHDNPSGKSQSEGGGQDARAPANRPDVTNSMAANIERWQGELRKWGDGSWDKWAERVADFRRDVERQLEERPAEIKGLIGKDGFLFFRGSLNYLTSADLRQQKDNRNPYPAIVDYSNQLRAKGIDFLFVIVPAKAEIFPEKVSDCAPEAGGPYVTPYTRKLMLELAEAGVEVVDLLPAFIEARVSKTGCQPVNGNEPIYMKQDTHWTHRGLRLAARMIGERVKQYPWFSQVCKQPVQYQVREVTFTRGGDIRGMLPDDEKIAYRPMKLSGQQVLNPDGSFYKDDKSSPIVILGDSFCGVYHLEDPKHAGISAHIAKEIGMPVDLIMAYGSGPGIRKRLARRGASAISKKRLVIWMTAARDLYDYWAPWELIKVP